MCIRDRAYTLPLLPIFFAWIGQKTGWANWSVAIPLLLAYVLVGIIQYFYPKTLKNPDYTLSSPSWLLYYRALPLLSPFLQLYMLYYGGEYWNSDALTIWGKLIYLLTIGMFSALFAINFSHELLHRPHAFDRAVSCVLLSMVCFGSFKIVHNKIHHRYVGTPLDFATAQRGLSIYRFWWRTYPQNFLTALNLEKARLAKSGQCFWHSELFYGYALSLVWLSLAVMLWGLGGAVFFLGQSFIAIGQLEWINYLQHYGLERRRYANGRYEPVSAEHSWSQSLMLHDRALLNLFRHADHHVHAAKPYFLLQHLLEAPKYPYQHLAMMGLSLIPPLFRKVVHPCLDRLQTNKLL